MSEYIGRAFEYTDIADRNLSELDHAYGLLARRQWGARAVSLEEFAYGLPESDDMRGYELHKELVDTMADYFYKTLGLQPEVAYQLVMRLKEDEVIPSLELCQASPLAAIEKIRLATFTGIAPIMMHMQSNEQFEKWLPDALRVVLPPSEGHGEACVNDDKNCQSSHCPARAMLEAALVVTYAPDYAEYSYKIDEERAFSNLRLLLVSLHDNKLIDKKTWQEWDDAAVEKYASTFMA